MIKLKRYADCASPELEALQAGMEAFYANPPPFYYQLAGQSCGAYTLKTLPFHSDLCEQIKPGMKIIEMGCGSAHLAPEVAGRGGDYTGVDYSLELIQANTHKYPEAHFYQMSEAPDGPFDIVASLYTLEHVVHPEHYLNKLWELCSPGGLIGIICPDFWNGTGISPSVFYGTTPLRLREKLARFKLLDSASHFWEMLFASKFWKKRALRAGPCAFWMNLAPRILNGALYSMDGDAIHLVSRADITHWAEQRGGIILRSSDKTPGAELAKHSMYFLIKKNQEP